MVGPEAQHGEKRLAGRCLLLLQGRPRSRQQLIPPANTERLVLLGSHDGRGFGMVRGQREWLFSALLVVVRGHVDEDALEEIAKTAAVRSGSAQAAAQEADGEILKQFVGGIRITRGGQQIATGRSTVALQKLPLGRRHLGAVTMSLVDDGPKRVDPAEVLLRVVWLHVCTPADLTALLGSYQRRGKKLAFSITAE